MANSAISSLDICLSFVVLDLWHVSLLPREKPNVIPPPGVPLPSTLVSNATTTSSCIQSVKVSTSREFLNAGGNPRGASVSLVIDRRRIRLNMIYSPFLWNSHWCYSHSC